MHVGHAVDSHQIGFDPMSELAITPKRWVAKTDAPGQCAGNFHQGKPMPVTKPGLAQARPQSRESWLDLLDSSGDILAPNRCRQPFEYVRRIEAVRMIMHRGRAVGPIQLNATDFRQPENAIEEASAQPWVGRIDQAPIIQTNNALGPRNCRPRLAAGVGVV
jgi:hypothetical protein